MLGKTSKISKTKLGLAALAMSTIVSGTQAQANDLLAQCDGIDRKGIIHEDKKNGKINRFPEKMCVKKIEIAQGKQEIAQGKQEIAQGKQEIAQGKIILAQLDMTIEGLEKELKELDLKIEKTKQKVEDKQQKVEDKQQKVEDKLREREKKRKWIIEQIRKMQESFK